MFICLRHKTKIRLPPAAPQLPPRGRHPPPPPSPGGPVAASCSECFFSMPSTFINSFADFLHRRPASIAVLLTGRCRPRRESSWSRLCSADCVGSIPPNVYFVLLRRTRIHRAPPSNVAEGGHARRDQRTPAAFSPLRTDTPSAPWPPRTAPSLPTIHRRPTSGQLTPSSLFFRH